MTDAWPAPTESFEGWLLRRVAHTVEAGQVSAALLLELQGEMATAREKPAEASQAESIRLIAELTGLSVETVTVAVESIDRLPAARRLALMQRIAEAWLKGQQGT